VKRLWLLTAFLPGALGANGALADGNPEAGAAKSAVCQACHGPTGNSANPEWPSLAGLGADYITEQLQNFKSGKRNNPIMMGNVLALTPEDMADLGAFFGKQVNTGLEADLSVAAAGEKLYRGGDKARGIPCAGSIPCMWPSNWPIMPRERGPRVPMESCRPSPSG
jgi:cytochrome c553